MDRAIYMRVHTSATSSVPCSTVVHTYIFFKWFYSPSEKHQSDVICFVKSLQSTRFFGPSYFPTSNTNKMVCALAARRCHCTKWKKVRSKFKKKKKHTAHAQQQQVRKKNRMSKQRHQQPGQNTTKIYLLWHIIQSGGVMLL